jgi:CheY-like chemotaxis protein
VPHQLLLADDSITIQRVIRLTFADEDVTVVTVGDGNQALAAIHQSPPDIVLADISIPGRNGYDIARFLRDSPRLAHIPVVLLTGAFDQVDQARATAVGCDRVLTKPFDPQLVIACVRELLGTPKKASQTAEASGSAAEPAADIDAYFDRLDEAFANTLVTPQSLNALPPEAYSIEIDEGTDPAVAAAESADRVLSIEPVSYASGSEAFGYPGEAAGHDSAGSALAEGGAAAAFMTPFQVVNPPNRAADLSEATIDEIATRVLDLLMVRLSNGSIPEAVTAAAERLVRAEIERLKSRL